MSPLLSSSGRRGRAAKRLRPSRHAKRQPRQAELLCKAVDGALLLEVARLRNLSLPGIGVPSTVHEVDRLVKSKSAFARFDIVNNIMGGDVRALRHVGEWFAARQASLNVSILEGGYKRFRHWALEAWHEDRPVAIVGGPTGSGKTDVLHALRSAAGDGFMQPFAYGAGFFQLLYVCSLWRGIFVRYKQRLLVSLGGDSLNLLLERTASEEEVAEAADDGDEEDSRRSKKRSKGTPCSARGTLELENRRSCA